MDTYKINFCVKCGTEHKYLLLQTGELVPICQERVTVAGCQPLFD